MAWRRQVSGRVAAVGLDLSKEHSVLGVGLGFGFFSKVITVGTGDVRFLFFYYYFKQATSLSKDLIDN